ncbi:hypothetical protein E3P92_03476 [Wallemia ichthyophaga]|uniref:5-aminovalerate aminotransferase DavT n=2 Tax=Wallemia ichthyophaga TaxID=245174 RepID=A0A4V4M623_WALIC|nr:uncharacterized protein J056_000930 [Wallemia ichthyophaga EXF-994]TIA71916.1 hypothetical protein E3P91_02272 [Wallemia ichthyophaga]EOR00392.1 hypothetical protein J056_000930 [Wallemia ichthyophaga EXF-994]TIA84558.1 hypothetical protein E3P98_00173 [Wallemia ichthyophaga]TIB04441.1 hypothetical protein E3P95_00178 [Wallemia ichthyophaga]TIB05500.1 hypothetical protein E3P94_00178 [Wallemia ichthyophaga]
MTDLIKTGQKHVASGCGRIKDHMIEKGEGSWLHTNETKYLDFTCGIGVTNLGHCHPRVTKAAQEQVATLVHGQCSIGFHRPYVQLIEKLLPVMPHPSLDSFFFLNSGSEAVENAVKIARKSSGKTHGNIICMQGSYHGRTYGASALTKSKTIYAEQVGHGMPGIFATPFPYAHQMGLPQSTPEDELVKQCLFQLEMLLAQQSAPADTAAIILEPVIGEGGYVPAPSSYLHGLRQICDDNNIMLIIDEVQSGFGRTGKYFASEYSGVRPDILVIAKGIANGFPLSGVVTRKELTDKMPKGSLGGTYSGNAISCAAGVECANIMREEKILDNVKARSAELLAALKELQTDSETKHLFADVRGLGLMIGVEFVSSSKHPIPNASISNATPNNVGGRVQKRCLEKGLMLLTTSAFDVIRFIPPLTITKDEMELGCKIFKESVREVAKEK